MSLEWRARFGGVPLVQWLAILFVIGLGLFPITLALLRLWAVTGITPLGALTTVHEQPGAVEAFRFSLLEAAASTGLTVAIGLPLAWAFGRYQWRNIRLKRALLFLPFVTPPVVAAVGFLALISPGGFLTISDLTCGVKRGSSVGYRTSGVVPPGSFHRLGWSPRMV